jgi:predicted TIM-barrel fold metal-dependent hydrolase
LTAATLQDAWQAASGGPIDDDMLRWPPDVFALANTILRRTEASRTLYGTDHPSGRPAQVTELIDALDCSAEDRELIYHGNLASLVKSASSSSTPQPSGEP